MSNLTAVSQRCKETLGDNQGTICKTKLRGTANMYRSPPCLASHSISQWRENPSAPDYGPYPHGGPSSHHQGPAPHSLEHICACARTPPWRQSQPQASSTFCDKFAVCICGRGRIGAPALSGR
eukprot:6206874-Pleurochrysis_carterae.AAC.1